MDLIGISGLAISIAGFALSLWQIRKTRTAAEAARAAADITAQALPHLLQQLLLSYASKSPNCMRPSPEEQWLPKKRGNKFSTTQAQYMITLKQQPG